MVLQTKTERNDKIFTHTCTLYSNGTERSTLKPKQYSDSRDAVRGVNKGKRKRRKELWREWMWVKGSNIVRKLNPGIEWTVIGYLV